VDRKEMFVEMTILSSIYDFWNLFEEFLKNKDSVLLDYMAIKFWSRTEHLVFGSFLTKILVFAL
jgi:hypothetical protein